MYRCKNLSWFNINKFKKLCEENICFNFTKEDFFKGYNNLNIIEKILYNKNVKLLKHNKEYIGYIWVNKICQNFYRINSMTINSSDDSLILYRKFFESFKKGTLFEVDWDFDMSLVKIGFKEVNKLFEMKVKLEEKYDIELPPKISFKTFEKGEDEDIRCDLQNKIFKTTSRIEIDIDDIVFEEDQKYYLNEGSIFIKYGEKFIGYGQLIKENNKISIVNFGVLDEFRNKGYGKILLKHILNVAIDNNFKEIYLKCNSDNTRALRLYKEHNFKIEKEFCTWDYTV
ncbi:MAG: GNAT family N-acetyltransferase [Clostridium argentinense]|uniref:GNAT family N-acetyltransferase n=1 Tax=Clostridium faecium TaxID=2762223 RepID=A0ABR8YWY7_9CLOT|nr:MULTISPECIES: GNAT family N-acetyltransferase [Clostridium]MBD8048793.1 GNAT family N-acetyltransferase [Clostridium faecium]MBS5823783.1 GNAT family N-acetyltransferase [Clostridium argentinense]MDU1350185.1 GNAT family N-acetyltransferase [Clostridium argentinense]